MTSPPGTGFVPVGFPPWRKCFAPLYSVDLAGHIQYVGNICTEIARKNGGGRPETPMNIYTLIQCVIKL